MLALMTVRMHELRLCCGRVGGFTWLQQPCMEELAVAAIPMSKARDEATMMRAARLMNALSAALQACNSFTRGLVLPALSLVAS